MNRLGVYAAVLAGILVLAGIVTLLVVVWPGGETMGTISENEAIAIATERVEAEGVMSLEGRDTVVEDDGSEWHVLFPFQNHNIRGGEPHVFISKADGSVTQIYYTE